MIEVVLALALWSAPTEAIPGTIGEQPALVIDPCVGADEQLVSYILDLELRGIGANNATRVESIAVRCLDGAQEIRVDPWAALSPDGIRTVQLPIVDEEDPAAREGRSRDLALAIAELIRRLEVDHPLAPPPPPPPPPRSPAAAPAVVVPARPPNRPRNRWQIGAAWAGESFSRGAKLLGGDIVVGKRFGRWFLAELRAGGRGGPDEALTLGRMTSGALTGAAAAGLCFWPHQRIGLGVMFRAEGYLLQLRAEYPDGGGTQTSVLGAIALDLEPRLMIAVAPHVWIQAAAGFGHTVHGVVVRVEGIEVASVSGVWLSGSLGVVAAF